MMDLLKVIFILLGASIVGLIGLALLVSVLSIPIWGAIWLIGEIIKSVV